MKAHAKFLEMVSSISEERKERLLSRMTGKLPRRLAEDKLSVNEALAIQLELEDDVLQEWRKNILAIRLRDEADEKKAKAAENEQKSVKSKPVLKAESEKKTTSAAVETKKSVKK